MFKSCRLRTLRCRRLASFDYDLRQWRENQEGKGGKEWVEGFKLMDADGGAAWDLATHVRSTGNPLSYALTTCSDSAGLPGWASFSLPLLSICAVDWAQCTFILAESFKRTANLRVCVPVRASVRECGGSACELTIALVWLQLVAFDPSRRLSAAAALRHPWVTASAIGSTLLKVKKASARTANAALGGERPWLGSVLEGARAVAKRREGFRDMDVGILSTSRQGEGSGFRCHIAELAEA